MNQLIMPLYLAPSLSWFKAIRQDELVLVSKGGAYDGDSGYNRLAFAGPHGLQQFSIPLVAESKKSDIAAVKISYAEKWSSQLINALRTAYGKSPFYEYYDYKIEPIISGKHEYLHELNLEILRFMLEAFKFKTELKTSELSVNWSGEGPVIQSYYQVFASQNGFIPGLSALDYLFNESWAIDWNL